jgi:hypothetical protein
VGVSGSCVGLVDFVSGEGEGVGFKDGLVLGVRKWSEGRGKVLELGD